MRLGYQAIDVLGHHVSQGCIQPDAEKVSCIKALQAPTTVRELRALLGLLGYYRRFIKDFATLAKPLTKLLKGDTWFEWG